MNINEDQLGLSTEKSMFGSKVTVSNFIGSIIDVLLVDGRGKRIHVEH
jgi:hypothetical protein